MRDKKIINKWSEIKRTIKNRPFLAYLVGIPLSEWNNYMTKTPPDEEINRIQGIIHNDRVEKTARLKMALSKIVGYRELATYAKKSMVSTTSIKDIIENKKTAAGYEVINKLELFVNALDPEFEISIENNMTAKSLVDEEFRQVIKDVDLCTSILKDFSLYLHKISKDLKNETSYYDRKPKNPSDSIDRVISILGKTKEKVDIINELYLDK